MMRRSCPLPSIAVLCRSAKEMPPRRHAPPAHQGSGAFRSRDPDRQHAAAERSRHRRGLSSCRPDGHGGVLPRAAGRRRRRDRRPGLRHRDLRRGAGAARMRDGPCHAYGQDHRMRLALLRSRRPATRSWRPSRATVSCSKAWTPNGAQLRCRSPLTASTSRAIPTVSLSRKACCSSGPRAMKRSTTLAVPLLLPDNQARGTEGLNPCFLQRGVSCEPDLGWLRPFLYRLPR